MDFATLIPSFGGMLFTLAAFVVALSVIVTVHEYGHYIVGRWSGIHAEVFSLGFGPVLWSRRDKRGTKWQIAALPFGGYVQFLGDANAASAGADGEVIRALSPEERRHTMHGAPLWARAATVAAGPLSNFILSILLFSALALSVGIAEKPLTIKKIYPLPTQGITLKAGDALLQVDGRDIPTNTGFADFTEALPDTPTLDYTVKRAGTRTDAVGPPLVPPRVAAVQIKSAARDAGLQVGDVITAINGTPITRFSDMIDIVEGSNGAPLKLSVWHAGKTRSVTLSPRRRDTPQPDGSFKTRWLMGVQSSFFFTPATRTAGPFEAAKIGVEQTWGVVRLSLSGLYNMLAGQISSCNISGPLGIAQSSGAMASQGASSFISFIALLSAAIGLLNLFPIPVLDGGHLAFFAWEAISGKPPNERVMNILMTIGLVLIVGLMVFGLGNDLFCR